MDDNLQSEPWDKAMSRASSMDPVDFIPPEHLPTYISDLEESVAMNRNLVHQLLIQKINSGHHKNAKQLEVAIASNVQIQSQIDFITQQAKAATTQALMQQQIRIASEQSHSELKEFFETKMRKAELGYQTIQDRLVKERQKNDELEDRVEALRKTTGKWRIMWVPEHLALHNQVEDAKFMIEKYGKKIYKYQNHIEILLNYMDPNEQYKDLDHANKMPLKLPLLLPPLQINSPAEVADRIAKLSEYATKLKFQIQILTNLIVQKSQKVTERYSENSDLMQRLAQAKQDTSKFAASHNEFFDSDTWDTSFSTIKSNIN